MFRTSNCSSAGGGLYKQLTVSIVSCQRVDPS